MSEQTITIPEATLRELVSAQIIAKFDDPKLIANFVMTMLEAKVDDYGRVSSRSDVSMMQWAVRKTCEDFVRELASEWLEERREDIKSVVRSVLDTRFISDVVDGVVDKARDKVVKGI